MEVEKRNNQIVAALTRDEVFDLQNGHTIGARPSVTMIEAKVEVIPLSAIERDSSLKDQYSRDRLEKIKKAKSKTFLWSDGDLQVFVPAILLTDVRVASITIPRESVETPGTEKRKELVEHVIPQEGIRLNFGGSLKIINIPDFFA